MLEETQWIEVKCEDGESLYFRRSNLPGALIQIQFKNENTIVEPKALLLAIKTITEEI